MKPNDLRTLFEKALKARGTEQVVSALESLLQEKLPEGQVLTIVANAGVHAIPNAYLRGDIYEASRGDWDASTEEELLLELKGILSRLVSKLRSRNWKRVYLIPTGHPILSLQIKVLVYRILRINTIDLYYKAGSYFEVDIDQRAIAIETGDHA